ncbi:MAG: UTP--glucose-1-phosphate uridylyltransferase, partial [Pseudomonadota bacterium]
MSTLAIETVVFPVAGLGTRFLPATKASPKEMLPIVDRPLIQYAVDEAVAAGARKLVFVTGRTKKAIEDYFDMAYELETELSRGGKLDLLDKVRSVLPEGISCSFVRQSQPLGLGHAVLCAKPVVGDQPFGVILPDDLIDAGKDPVMKQLARQYSASGRSVISVKRVPMESTQHYGVVDIGQAAGPVAA